MKRAEQIAFPTRLRSAREAGLKDAEAFDGIIHVIESLGKFIRENPNGNLGQYQIIKWVRLLWNAGRPA